MLLAEQVRSGLMRECLSDPVLSVAFDVIRGPARPSAHQTHAMLFIERGYELTGGGSRAYEANVAQCVGVIFQDVRAVATAHLMHSSARRVVTIGDVLVSAMPDEAIKAMLRSSGLDDAVSDKMLAWNICAQCSFS